MKKSLLFVFMLGSMMNLSATTLVVTSSDYKETTVGTLPYCVKNATDGDVIEFDFDGTEINLAGGTMLIQGKSITINGINKKNNQKIALTGPGYFSIFEISKSEEENSTAGTLFLNNIVIHNIAEGSDSAIKGIGGGKLVATNCEFINLESGTMGAVLSFNHSPFELEQCVFKNNISFAEEPTEGGGAIRLYGTGSKVIINSCSFIGNVSYNRGGAIYAQNGAEITAYNCTFTQNEAVSPDRKGTDGGTTDRGGALFLAGSSSNTTAHLINCTIAGNIARTAGGGLAMLSSGTGRSTATLINTIIAYNINEAANPGYNDLREFLKEGDNVGDVANAYNCIYGVATAAFNSRIKPNTVQVTAAEANVFETTELFTIDNNKNNCIRPLIKEINGVPIAMISVDGIANGTGTPTTPLTAPAKLEIPKVDQTGNNRPATPAIGAVEYQKLTSVSRIAEEGSIKIWSNGSFIYVSGLTNGALASIYDVNGQLIKNINLDNSGYFDLTGIDRKMIIVKVETDDIMKTAKILME